MSKSAKKKPDPKPEPDSKPGVVITGCTFNGGPTLEALREIVRVLDKLADKLSTTLLQIGK